jgi:two-component system NtrC family sensor kinase
VVKFRKSLDSLAGKLIIAIGMLMFAGSLVFGFIFFKYEESVTMRNLLSHGRFSADLVLRGVHDDMLTARPQAVQQTLEDMGRVEDVREIKIFNKEGLPVHSSTGPIPPEKIPQADPAAMEVLEKNAELPPTITTSPSGAKVLRLYTPIRNEVSCYTAKCHFHSRDEKVLGVLLTSLSASSIETASRQILIGTLFFGGIFIGSISVFICLILYKFVSKPVALLEEGMKRLGRGDFDHPIEVYSRDEMGLLASTFNSMAYDIKRFREKLENWALELQREVDRKTAEIMEAQEQLVNAEKLASLGRLAAGVAHELNSPLTGIVTFAHLMRQRVSSGSPQDSEDLDIIIEQANRCSKIIKGLLGFSRKGDSEKIQININDLLENSLSMVKNQSKFHNVKIESHLSRDIPTVTADPNQIQQVIINMLSNAADAMKDRGEITIATRSISENGAEFIEMEFTDTGPGIIPEHMGRIFEPFFTTKAVGKGTGLGLPVSYGIVKRHGGDIIVKSKAGRGTSFVIRLPLKVNEDGMYRSARP